MGIPMALTEGPINYFCHYCPVRALHITLGSRDYLHIRFYAVAENRIKSRFK
jgi:hypothetical protein